jgi:magnesium-transporting ATPase (P-type)
MKALPRRRSIPVSVALPLLSSLALLLAVPAFAQEGPSTAQFAAMGAMFVVMMVFFVAIYIYYALAFQTIAKKTNTENGWLAWIPIANIILLLNIAKKPLWWIILCLIPLVNLVIIIIVFMAVAEARKKPSWWGILMIVPLVNLIVPGYLAWSD